jgi:hypothetical protein
MEYAQQISERMEEIRRIDQDMKSESPIEAESGHEQKET